MNPKYVARLRADFCLEEDQYWSEIYRITRCDSENEDSNESDASAFEWRWSDQVLLERFLEHTGAGCCVAHTIFSPQCPLSTMP